MSLFPPHPSPTTTLFPQNVMVHVVPSDECTASEWCQVSVRGKARWSLYIGAIVVPCIFLPVIFTGVVMCIKVARDSLESASKGKYKNIEESGVQMDTRPGAVEEEGSEDDVPPATPAESQPDDADSQ